MFKDREARLALILADLQSVDEPISGQELALRHNITRQVVVHDVALLRAAGHPILSTPRGYLMERDVSARTRDYILSVAHPPHLTGAELYTLVDHGLQIKNVVIEHPLYGELIGSLRLASRMDVEYFLKQVARQKASLLSSLTDGHHMHTVETEYPDRLQEAIESLRKQGIAVDD